MRVKGERAEGREREGGRESIKGYGVLKEAVL